MSVIQKVASRLQARRRAGSTDVTQPSPRSETSSSPGVSFSRVTRQTSSDFCLVDDNEGLGDEPVERSGFLESSDNLHHELEQVTEELFDDDSEQPRPKPHDKQRGASKPWREASKDVYEQQLELLQEQLMSTMLEKQTLESELHKHKSAHHISEKEVEDLRKEIALLSRRLKGPNTSKGNEGASLTGGNRSYAGGSLQVSTSEEGYQEVTLTSNDGTATRSQTQKKGYIQSIRDKIYDFLADFTEDPAVPVEQPEEPTPLAYKKLKDNLQRLLHTSKPWRDTAQHAQDILQWKHTAETLVIFLLYMYCVWNGWIITVALLIAVVKLSITYLHASGLAEQFGFPYPYRTQMREEPGLANKLQLVKKVAQTGQNISGQTANALEKTQNLLLWHQPEATQRLYFVLLGWFVASLVLSNSTILTIVGLGIGVKLFIIDNIYRKYPRVQAKYDTVHRIWKTLPTDAELYRRQSLTEEELHRSQSADSISSDGSGSPSPTHSDEHTFSQRFQIPRGEHPLPSWEHGKRCSIMDRDRPLSLTKSGRLYMTHSWLCFERMSHSARDSDRIAILLADVVCVVKAKPFAVLPGSGMSIEVTQADGKKYLFSAILGRDQVYQNILDQGMLLGLPWGSDLTTGASGNVNNTRAASLEASSINTQEIDNTTQELESF